MCYHLSMIEELQPKDMQQAIDVFVKGAAEENPPGGVTPEIAKKDLERTSCFVYKADGDIEGLLTFSALNPKTAAIKFICSLKHRKGVGSELVAHLAEQAKETGAGKYKGPSRA